MRPREACIALLSALAALNVHAATIVIQVADGAGEGFNDPTPVADLNDGQEGNNPGATLGELRLNLFEAAAAVWEGILESDVTITVNASFDPLTCGPTSGTLGSAGAASSLANFGAGQANTSHPIALAESLAGGNLNGGGAEINATFNSNLDSDPMCLGGEGFYYGIDGNAPTGMSPLFPVVLHELGHGLGFASQTNSAGQFVGAGSFPDTFSRNLFDLETAENWGDMTDGERAASSLNDPDLVWQGARVTADRGDWLANAPELVINAPPGIAGTYDVVLGDEPTIILDSTGVTADVVDGDSLVADCNPIFDAGATSGKILLFERTDACFSPFRAYFGEAADAAVGVIISNDTADGDADVGGQISNQDVTIPYVGTTQAVGNDLRANIASANATIRRGMKLIGENQGQVRMYAPAVFQPGSSVSHWSSDATGDLLMEPRLGNIGFDQVDLTPAAFEDIGWSVIFPGQDPPLIFRDGFETQQIP